MPIRSREIEKVRAGRIVRRADGVDAQRLELRQPPLHGALGSGHAEAVEVLVIGDALELDALPLRVIPVVPSNVSSRIPNGVTSSSTVAPPT